MCISEENIISGVIASFIWSLIVLLYLLLRRQIYWYGLNGIYEVRKKFLDQNSEKIEYEISIHRIGNLLYIKSINYSLGDFQGEILLDTTYKRTGKGFYQQKIIKNDTEVQLWGYFDITIRNRNEIFVNRYYVNNEKGMVFQGFTWKKKKAPA